MISPPQFVLASASTARRKLLQTAGIEPIICSSNYDESQIQLDDPQQLVETLAVKKAETVAQQFHDALILGCDSVLAIDGKIYGKPATVSEAIARWQTMSGNSGMLYTGHALIAQQQQQTVVACGKTKVYFAPVGDHLISAYVDSNEPLKCAGAFALEGKGGLMVEKIEGCHSNVIGLSLPLLRRMLEQLGYSVGDYWQSN